MKGDKENDWKKDQDRNSKSADARLGTVRSHNGTQSKSQPKPTLNPYLSGFLILSPNLGHSQVVRPVLGYCRNVLVSDDGEDPGGALNSHACTCAPPGSDILCIHRGCHVGKCLCHGITDMTFETSNFSGNYFVSIGNSLANNMDCWECTAGPTKVQGLALRYAAAWLI